MLNVVGSFLVLKKDSKKMTRRKNKQTENKNRLEDGQEVPRVHSMN